MIKKYWNMAVQFLKFGIVGASNTLVSMAIYYLLLFFGIHYIPANTAGYIAGTLNAYYWNSKYVFKKEDGEVRSARKSLFRSFLAYGVTYLISTALLYIWVDIFGISDKIAPIMNLVITTPLNFLLNKLWAFKRDKSEKGQEENEGEL